MSQENLDYIIIDHNLISVGGAQSLLKTKNNEDQGFEIIKEVPGSMPRMGNPFAGSSMLNNPNLSSLAALMSGGNLSNINNMSSLLAGMNSGASNMSGLINQSNMLQKCKYSQLITDYDCTDNCTCFYFCSHYGLDAWYDCLHIIVLYFKFSLRS